MVSEFLSAACSRLSYFDRTTKERVYATEYCMTATPMDTGPHRRRRSISRFCSPWHPKVVLIFRSKDARSLKEVLLCRASVSLLALHSLSRESWLGGKATAQPPALTTPRRATQPSIKNRMTKKRERTRHVAPHLAEQSNTPLSVTNANSGTSSLQLRLILYCSSR